MDNQHEKVTVSRLTPEQREILDLKLRVERLEQQLAAQSDSLEERVMARLRIAYFNATAAYSG